MQKLANTATNALSDFQRMIHVFDVCRACGQCVFDGTLFAIVGIFCCFVFSPRIYTYTLHTILEEKADLKFCPNEDCKEPRTSKCQILVLDIVSRLQKLMTHKHYAKAFRCFVLFFSDMYSYSCMCLYLSFLRFTLYSYVCSNNLTFCQVRVASTR